MHKTLVFVILVILMSNVAFGVGKIVNLQGDAIVKRNGKTLDASEGMKLNCQDTVIGEQDETKVTLYVNGKRVEFNGTEDWEISCGEIGGEIVSFQGRTIITRGIRKLPATERMSLMVGDKVVTTGGAKIELKNGQIIKLRSGDSTVVPETKNKGILGRVKNTVYRVKNWFINLIRGESFEIDVGPRGTGARG